MHAVRSAPALRVVSGLAAPQRAEPDSLRWCFEAMASRCELVLAGVPAAKAQAAAQRATAEVRRIEAKYSRYQADSVISRINQAAGTGKPVPIDAETQGLLDYADRLHDLSGGRFDLSSGPLRRAWDFRKGIVPSEASLAAVLPLIGWQRIERGAGWLRLPQAGMELDLGGIGKEYAADRAAAVLAEAGVQHGFVNLGGDLRLLGPAPDGRPWRLGIQHPRQVDEVCAHLHLSQGALATSGDYERYFITPEGRRCCHILDPRSGQPVAHWQSISVIAPLCSAAGALATIAMLIGPGATDFLRAQGVAFLAVDPQGRIEQQDLPSPSLTPHPHSP